MIPLRLYLGACRLFKQVSRCFGDIQVEVKSGSWVSPHVSFTAESSLCTLERAVWFPPGGRTCCRRRRRCHFDACLMCVMQRGTTDHFYVGVKDALRCLRRDDDNTTLSH